MENGLLFYLVIPAGLVYVALSVCISVDYDFGGSFVKTMVKHSKLMIKIYLLSISF